mgnify:CR=1 FL=1
MGAAGGAETALLSQGIHTLASFVGDLVPGQLGVTEGAFRLWEDVVGAGTAAAVAVPVLLHLVVVLWVEVGALGGSFWRSARREDRKPEALGVVLAT